MTATGIVALFSALSAASYGAGGSIGGLIASLSAYRFLLGIGVSANFPYPPSSKIFDLASCSHLCPRFLTVTSV